MSKFGACIFNAYGTLLDNYQPFEQYSADLGDNALLIYKLWRSKRLQYSSQLSLMNRHTSYEKITKYALDFACDVYGVRDEAIKDSILKAHEELGCYDDVIDTLKDLKEHGLVIAVLSNGAPQSLKHAIKRANLDDLIDRTFSTDQIHSYKPSPAVYEHVAENLPFPKRKISFVSTNSWDVAGAVSYGYYTVWLNRNNRTAERLPYTANEEIKALSELGPLIY